MKENKNLAANKGNGKIYKNVQFVGVAISTTPACLTSIEETSDDGYYPGELIEIRDFNYRLSYVKDTVKKILKSTDSNPETLKVIVFPEFLMRGVLGAYNLLPEHDIIHEIRSLVEDPDVMIVIGSILTTPTMSLPPTEKDNNYHLGDHLLDVYYRLHPKSSRKELHKLLKSADYSEDYNKINDLPYQDVLVNALNYSDIVATHVISNKCYICTKDEVFTVLKQYKSKEDFILNSTSKDAPKEIKNIPLYLQTTTKYDDIKENEHGVRSVFEYGGIKFGVEICLDHKKGRLKGAGYKDLDVQIIPSCGMSIMPKSVCLRNGGYVFNCDGEYVLENSKQGVNALDSHTSLCRMKGESLSDAYQPVRNDDYKDKHLATYFRHDQFSIHIYETVSL